MNTARNDAAKVASWFTLTAEFTSAVMFAHTITLALTTPIT